MSISLEKRNNSGLIFTFKFKKIILYEKYFFVENLNLTISLSICKYEKKQIAAKLISLK